MVRNGGVAVVGVGNGHFADEAHVVVINGYAKDKDGKEWFFVVNPGRRDQRDKAVSTTPSCRTTASIMERADFGSPGNNWKRNCATDGAEQGGVGR